MQALRVVYTLLMVALAASLPAQILLDGAVSRRNLPMNLWQATSGTIDPFSPVEAFYAPSQDEWVLSPNDVQPRNCFGWIQGPRMLIPRSTDTLYGNIAGFKINFTYTRDFFGAAPEIRPRMNSADFGLYAIGGITTSRFRQWNGTGEAVVIIDRNLLLEDTEFNLFIDLIGFQTGPTGLDPDFEVRINSIEYFCLVSNSAYFRNDLISAAYLDSENDVWAFVGGSRDDILLRNGIAGEPTSYAFDGAYAIIIAGGDLYGYSTLGDLEQIVIDDEYNVVSAGISDHHVVYITGGDLVRYYNFVTGEQRTIGSSRDYLEVYGSGDGDFVVTVEDGGDEDLYHFDTRLDNPALTILIGDRVLDTIRCRSTGRVQ